MSEIVLDASVVLRWAFADEGDRDGAMRVAEAIADGRLTPIGPPNFLLEVAAALVVGIRVGRMDRATADAVLRSLERVGIDEVDAHGFASSVYTTALDGSIRVPDAAYIETARRRGAPLVSEDRRQLAAAHHAGVRAISAQEVPAQDS